MTSVNTWMQERMSTQLDENIRRMNQILGVEKSFDVICRQYRFSGRRFALYFVDGLVKDDIWQFITQRLSELEPGELAENPVDRLEDTYLGYLEVERFDRLEPLVTGVLSGPLALFVDGAAEALLIDARTYPARQPEEPDIERVVRGARDGFTETLIFNTALTRRRVRDPSLRMEYMQIGRRSKTDVCLAYLEDVADPRLVNMLRERLNSFDLDGLPMGEKTLEEFLFRKNWNPFPMVRYTERPDVAAVHLLEGHVLVYTDTSPSVMITPTTLFHHVQHAEEYRQKPVVGAYLRWVRFIAIIASVVVPPLWLLLVLEPELGGARWDFIRPDEKQPLSVFWQFLLADLGVDALRMAAIHTPSALTTAIGLVAAILIGQVAVDVGLFTNEVILYLAIASIGTFATPSYELSLANRLVRLLLLVAVYAFRLPGLVAAFVLLFVLLASTRSLNMPYLWPLVPFNGPALLDVLVRAPVPAKGRRPSAISPQDPDRVDR